MNSLLDSLRLSVADLEAAAAGAAKLEIELEEARTRADIAVAELSSAKTRTIPDLEKRLATAEADVVKLSSDLRNANEKLANETARLEGDLAMIGEETARLVHEVETLSTSLEETENKLEHRTTELRDSRGELDALRSKLAEREEWTKRLEGEVRTLKKQLKEGVVKSVVSSPADAVSPEEITDVKATAILDGAPIPLAHMTRDQLEARVGYLSELLQEADGKLFACTMELNRVRG